MNWTVRAQSPSVATVNVCLPEGASKGTFEQWVLLGADRHIDNPKADHRMMVRHLDEAKERNAIILDIGDFFCAMQGKFDPRAYKSDLKEENKTGTYLNSLVESGYNFWDKYKENLAVFAEGNHESAIRKRTEFCLTKALTEKLQDNGSPVVSGGYRGWVRFQFKLHNTRASVNMYYTHGGGGGGEVTKGVIKTNRRAVYLPDAQLVVGGHIHEAWMVELTRARLKTSGVEYRDEQVHLAIPTYKDEFFGATGGYHHEKERPPKPLGAWWVRFFYDLRDDRIRFEVARAK